MKELVVAGAAWAEEGEEEEEEEEESVWRRESPTGDFRRPIDL